MPTQCTIRQNITISPGTPADYQALAPFHYRPAHPVAVTRIFVAWHQEPPTPDETSLSQKRRTSNDERPTTPSPTRAGILIEARPLLNCALRNLAFPHRYTSLPKPLAAALLNHEIRLISRIIIDPRFRAIGIGTALVKHLLQHAQTPCIEALAAMGRTHPLFQNAGMRPYDRPLPPDAARLTAALTHEHLAPTDLLTLTPAQLSPFLTAELKRFTKTQSKSPLTPSHFQQAHHRLLSRPIYYLWQNSTRRVSEGVPTHSSTRRVSKEV